MTGPVPERGPEALEPAGAELLGEVLGELAELVGLPATLALIDGWGGTRLYVPEPGHLHARHPLVEAVGMAAATAIAQRFQREELAIPRAVALVRRVRDRRIRAEHAPQDGMSAARLARRWRLSLRQIRYILAATDDDALAAQLDTPQFTLL